MSAICGHAPYQADTLAHLYCGAPRFHAGPHVMVDTDWSRWETPRRPRPIRAAAALTLYWMAPRGSLRRSVTPRHTWETSLRPLSYRWSPPTP